MNNGLIPNIFEKKKFLFVSYDALISDVAWQVTKEGHEVKYYIKNPVDKDSADGLVTKIDSWENEIITRTHRTKDCWYAALDTIGAKYCYLDFVTGAETREDAIRLCSLKIRLDVRGIGKFAPHRDLQGYNFFFKLAEYWRRKETRRKSRRKHKV